MKAGAVFVSLCPYLGKTLGCLATRISISRRRKSHVSMRTFLRLWIERLTFAILAFSLMSCGGGPAPAPPAPPAPPPPPGITVSVSPASATIPAADTLQFTASVQNTTNTAVTWQVNGIAGGDSTVGTISTSGDYTAPLSPPDSGMVTITAVSQADSTKSGSATATIVFSNATLSGQYAFSFTGVDTNGFFFVAGSFTADGNGNLTNGIEDLNDRTGVFTNVSFTGAYSIVADGRGSATFTSSSGTANLRFVVLSNQKAEFIQFDTLAGGQGTITKQDTSAFATSALSGDFSFQLDGISANGPISTSGRFTLDGAGGISAGVRDVNDTGLVTMNDSFTGTYSASSSGRGTATLTGGSLGTLNFSLYVVSANELFFVSLDALPAMIGQVKQQEATSFSNASLAGDYALLVRGVSTSGAIGGIGRFSADGSGGITSGVLDGNISGQVFENLAFTGTYSISSNGRGTATLSSVLGSVNLALYMVSGSQVLLVQVNNFAVTSGTFMAQQGVPFTASSVSGSFGFSAVGIQFGEPFALTGQLTADGAGAINGTVDANVSGVLVPDRPFIATYTVSSNGRGLVSQLGTGSPVRFYVVTPRRVLVGGVVQSGVWVGTLEKQF